MKRAKLATSAIAFTLLTSACVVGCSPSRGEMAIPPTAQILAQGQNGLVSATPNVAGTVYVYDASDNRLIYSAAVNGGDHVVVDPGANLITINNATVGQPHLANDHMYMIKFDQP